MKYAVDVFGWLGSDCRQQVEPTVAGTLQELLSDDFDVIN